MSFILYHHPRCSKSRQALKLLEASGQPFEIVEYLKKGLTLNEVKGICRRLNCHPSDIIRTKERDYISIKETLVDASQSAWFQAIVDHPILLERPIIIKGENAVVGRPVARVEAMLSGDLC